MVYTYQIKIIKFVSVIVFNNKLRKNYKQQPSKLILKLTGVTPNES